MKRTDAVHRPAATRRLTPRRIDASLASAVLCLPLLAACGGDSGDSSSNTSSSASQDFCAQYEDLSAAAEELSAKDPATADVEELRAASDDVQSELDQFQAVAEGPLDAALTRLRANVDAVRQAAQEAGSQARETAQPVIEDALTRVKAGWAVVLDLAEVRCPPAE